MTVLTHWFGCSESNRKNLEIINDLTPDTTTYDFASKVAKNWESVEPSFRRGGKDNSTRGELLELILCSAIMEAGVKSHHLKRNVKFSPGDIDILVTDCAMGAAHGISSKVSSRERWAVADRDAGILLDPRFQSTIKRVTNGLGGDQITSWYVCWKEQCSDSIEKAVRHARSIGRKCAFIQPGHCTSILDKERMQNLIYHITGTNQ